MKLDVLEFFFVLTAEEVSLPMMTWEEFSEKGPATP
jgi:hypothetical protein